MKKFQIIKKSQREKNEILVTSNVLYIRTYHCLLRTQFSDIYMKFTSLTIINRKQIYNNTKIQTKNF